VSPGPHDRSAHVRSTVAPHRTVQHIDGRFLYRVDGYGALPAALAATLPRCAIRTEHDVVGFDVDGDRLARIRFAGRPSVEVEGRVVATLPLTILVRLLGDTVPELARRAAAALRFRSVRLLFLRLARRGAITCCPTPTPSTRSAGRTPRRRRLPACAASGTSISSGVAGSSSTATSTTSSASAGSTCAIWSRRRPSRRTPRRRRSGRPSRRCRGCATIAGC
jgi:hypothetical protein